MKVGGREEIQSDIRIITATNRDLYMESQEGRFREDLYWRLSVIEINIPELKERKGDIRLLSKVFFNIFCKKFNFQKSLAPETYDILCNYDWPGNVRQLKNFMEKLVITVESEIIYPKDVAFIERKALVRKKEEPLEAVLYEEDALNGMVSLEDKKTELERKLVVKAFEKYKTCRLVAENLQISSTKAHRLIHNGGTAASVIRCRSQPGTQKISPVKPAGVGSVSIFASRSIRIQPTALWQAGMFSMNALPVRNKLPCKKIPVWSPVSRIAGSIRFLSC